MVGPTYSFIIPIYNEAEALPELRSRICETMDRMDGSVEVILIDDGSRDGSYEIMLEINRQDPRFRIVHFARNFGHQIAISAGMDLCGGQAIIIMDADLQDPPEVVLEMAERWREGYEVVYGIRGERKGETRFKRATAAIFYRVLRSLTDLDVPADVGDFRLVDRKRWTLSGRSMRSIAMCAACSVGSASDRSACPSSVPRDVPAALSTHSGRC